MSSTLGRLSNIVIALVAAAPDRAIAGVTVAVISTPAAALRPTSPKRPPSTPLAVRFVSGIGLIVGELPGRTLDGPALSRPFPRIRLRLFGDSMTTWEYLTTPLLIHNTAAILNNWGKQGWELVQVVPGPEGGLVAYLKRPVGGGSANAGLDAAALAAQQFEEPRSDRLRPARRARDRSARGRSAGGRLRPGESAWRSGLHGRPAADGRRARCLPPARSATGMDSSRRGCRTRTPVSAPSTPSPRRRGRRRSGSPHRRREGRRLRGIRSGLHRSARRHQRRERRARATSSGSRAGMPARRSACRCSHSTARSRSRSSSPTCERASVRHRSAALRRRT